jgi:O-6-methylguanine DNA methyltransferase
MPGSARGSGSEFRARVIRVVRRIPAGRVATYGDVAIAAGRPRAWRAVGTIMRTCGESAVPCHRVIASGGRLGGYGGNEMMKAALLRAEGLIIANGRVRQFGSVRWKGGQSHFPPKGRSKSVTVPLSSRQRD